MCLHIRNILIKSLFMQAESTIFFIEIQFHQYRIKSALDVIEWSHGANQQKNKILHRPIYPSIISVFCACYALSNSVYKQQLDFPSWTSLVSVTPTAPRVWVATLLLVSQNNIWINTEKKQPKKHSPNTLDTVYLVQLPTQWQTGV